MAIPTPPPDESGGFIVIKYTNGSQVHRSRFHVFNAFLADATGSYVDPPGGMETDVAATATAVMAQLKVFYPNQWTFSLDAVYQNVGGTPVEIFSVTPPAPQVGTNGSTDNGRTEEAVSRNFRTANGHRMRFFELSTYNWVYSPASTEGANSSGTPGEKLCAYFSGIATGVRGHDGAKCLPSIHSVWSLNKRLRRRAGNA